MNFTAKWITGTFEDINIAPVFGKSFRLEKPVKKAELFVTALGVYEGKLNGERIGAYVLAPGWTSYAHRLQYQKYDVTALLKEENRVEFTVGRGWYSSPMGFNDEMKAKALGQPRALLSELHIKYADGSCETILTDGSWEYGESPVRFSEIYDGEKYDASFETKKWLSVKILDHTYDTLIPQEGEEIREVERVKGQSVLVTPEGDTLIDFGQEVTGYVEFTVTAKKGDRVHILHSEVNDKYGNFYNENYRAAKAEIVYTCKEGLQTWHPCLTFFGFRYIKLSAWPGDLKDVKAEDFTAIAVASDMKRTGRAETSDPLLNRFISNVFWGQRGNFLDIPTDCPQRDERLGWTGDAQVFCKAASYNYDTLKFFKKWLKDVYADQMDVGGGVPHFVPDISKSGDGSAAWGDVACIIPWQMYLTYGDKEVLKDQLPSMKEWVKYIARTSTKRYLWTGKGHYGDWLGLDAPVGSYKGSSREDFIASAFYAYSVELIVKTLKVLGRKSEKYEALHEKIVERFRRTYKKYKTQTEHVLAIRFGLSEDPKKTADDLNAMILKAGRMETGFVGTPYLLHVLSDYGHADTAYDLLLRREYPSWIYPVTKGATTVWEHWDGIMENGDFWSKDMNSFNHYSYGAVIDWIYEKAAGIRPMAPGFEKITVAPLASDKLDWLLVSLDTRAGLVTSKWSHVDGKIRYDITLPAEGEIIIAGKTAVLPAGSYTFWG